MSETWAAVDEYFGGIFASVADPVLEGALTRSREAGLPGIQVSPLQGRLLWVLARAVSARTILEVGTLGGYSTICLARALRPTGRLISLEVNPRHAEVARQNLAAAHLSASIEVRVGDAGASLGELAARGEAEFDLVFFDANKDGYDTYLRLALPLCHPGTLLVADNVVRRGAVADASSTDADVQGVRRFTELLGALPNVEATAVQTVGAKGHDGFILAVVT